MLCYSVRPCCATDCLRLVVHLAPSPLDASGSTNATEPMTALAGAASAAQTGTGAVLGGGGSGGIAPASFLTTAGFCGQAATGF